ncbi:MAG TPA: SGNH/GDSL hydrolase family protein [Dermatophilaceae bacterium]
MNVLSQLRLRPRRTLLSAIVLVCVPSWAILGFAARSPAGGSSTPTPKAATTSASVASPAPAVSLASAVVVGIGDSVTSATVCGCTGFVESYAAHLPAADGGPARAENLGAGGLTAAGLRTLMTQPGPTPTSVAEADVLLVTIGANDLTPLLSRWQSSGCSKACYSPAVETVGSDLGDILAAARSLRGHRPTRVLVTDYWNVFADGDVARASDGPAYLRWSDELTRALNVSICNAARNAGATCVDLYAPFKGDGSKNPTELLAADGDHPNAAGNQVISSALLAAS